MVRHVGDHMGSDIGARRQTDSWTGNSPAALVAAGEEHACSTAMAYS